MKTDKKSQKNKNTQPYVDLRFYITEEEPYPNEPPTYTIDRVERHKVKGISEDDLDALGESFAQMDSYQLFFVNDVPYTLSEGVTEKF